MAMIVGYYVGGTPDEIGQTPLCAACAMTAACGEGDPGSHPIFCWDEADSPTHCEDCGALIPHALTSDGLAYVIEAIHEHLATGRGRREVLFEWAEQYAEEYAPMLEDPS